jgi:nitrogenase molybdenum-iron protein alpha/beta subunit
MSDVQDPASYPSFLTGVYLAVNAISDAYLVVDGPNCAFFRIPQIQPNHDWLSDLARSSGVHRVVDTDATPSRVAQGNPAILLERLAQTDRLEDCAAILITPMSHVAITGRQYAPLIESLDPPVHHPVIQVASGSLSGDWLDGYANTLAALARDLPLDDAQGSAPTPVPPAGAGRVALVGHLLHRLEADATADLDELQRMITGLDLEVVSAWPAGGAIAGLAAASRADTVVSLPYAREAGRVLAARIGATLVELDLPLGLDGTSRFLRRLGEATDRSAQAETFLEAELRRVVPRLEWVLAHELLGRRVLTAGDPHLVAGLRPALTELGCTVERELIFARSEHGATPPIPSTPQTMHGPALPLHHVAPNIQHLTQANDGRQLARGIDLGVVCSLAVDLLQDRARRIPFVEVGYPSYYSHALYPQPVLGFDGTLCLVSRLVSALRHGAAIQG